LDQLGNLSLEVRIEEYSNFDLLTGMSWKTALETIDARLRLFPVAENRMLQRWKIVIEKAYAELRENLPGFEPTTFTSLLLAADGRSEDSSYPNLAVAEEREPYGL